MLRSASTKSGSPAVSTSPAAIAFTISGSTGLPMESRARPTHHESDGSWTSVPRQSSSTARNEP